MTKKIETKTDARKQKEFPEKQGNPSGRIWVNAKVIAALFDLSPGAVYRGEAGMDKIRWAYLPGTEHKARPTRRFYYSDAWALHERMLKEAEPKRELIPGNILALMPRNFRRRSG